MAVSSGMMVYSTHHTLALVLYNIDISQKLYSYTCLAHRTIALAHRTFAPTHSMYELAQMRTLAHM